MNKLIIPFILHLKDVYDNKIDIKVCLNFEATYIITVQDYIEITLGISDNKVKVASELTGLIPEELHNPHSLVAHISNIKINRAK